MVAGRAQQAKIGLAGPGKLERVQRTAQGAPGMGADVWVVGRVTIERAGRMGNIVDMRQVMGALDGFIILDLKRSVPVDFQVLLFAQKFQRATDALGALGMAGLVVFQAALVGDDVHGPPHCGVKRGKWQSFGVAKGRWRTLCCAGRGMAEYKVQFEVFEGPLDLLLYLVKKEEVDIYEVNLTKIAREFIEYVDLMRELDLELAGEFVVMAATLVHIKSRELLPVDQQVIDAEEEEGDDPRWELIRKLVEYKKFKDAADQLQEREAKQENVFPRLPVKPDFVDEMPPPRLQVSIFDLVNAVNAVIKRVELRGGDTEIYDDEWTVADKITTIRQRMTERESWKFTEFFADAASKNEVVATFLAMLELIRLRHIEITQSEQFGKIEIARGQAHGTAPVMVTDDYAGGGEPAAPPDMD